MRSGLLCRRRFASSSSASAWRSKCAISASRCARRSSGWPRLLSSSRTSRPTDQAELAPQRAHHQDHLGVDVRAGKAERLDVELVELAVAALLRPLVAEHRPHRPQAQRAVVERVVLDHRAHDAGGGLGAQRELVAVHRVGEGVHLLLDDVGHLAQAAHEQRRRLDDRRQRGTGSRSAPAPRARWSRTRPRAPSRAACRCAARSPAGCRSCP